MDEHTPPPAPIPELQPQTNQPVMGATPVDNAQMPPLPANPMAKIKELGSKHKGPLAIAGIILVVIIVSTLVASAARRPAPPVAPRPTPTPAATPTPIREMSSVASESAFILFTESVASLSASIQKVNIYDSTLTPPVLDLPLGFK